MAAVSLLPPVSAAAASALTVTQIAQATTALLTALRRFQQSRGVAFDAELRKEALAQEPTLGDVIDNIIGRELGFEATFRAKQYDRMQAALGPALSIQDAAQREAAVRGLFERERRYTQMREEAMRVRTMAAVRHYHLEHASPQGAYWRLGEGVQQHTLDCLAMANQFWPWTVLHAFQPPVHHGCACSLMSLNEAVGHGLMTTDQVPDEMSAVHAAATALQKAANAMRGGQITEADIGAYVSGLRLMEDAPYPIGVEDRVRRSHHDLSLGAVGGSVTGLGTDPKDGAVTHDVRWDDGTVSAGVRGSDLRCVTPLNESRWTSRFAKGTENAGRFRPRVGGDPGAMLLRKLGLGQRGKVMHDLMPSTRPLAQSQRGQWTWLRGRYVHVPHATPWKKRIGGHVFRSPAGTTNVYRDGVLEPQKPITGTERNELHERVAELQGMARDKLLDRQGAPLRDGDGPEAVLAMDGRGYEMTGSRPVGPGAWKVSFRHPVGALASAIIDRFGTVGSTEWDTSPIPEQHPRHLRTAPKSFREHTADALSWANELGEKYGVGVHLKGIQLNRAYEDHAGFHEWSGQVHLGRDTKPDIERAAAARAAGRPLTDDEARGVWSTYWTTAHETGHSVNPMRAREYHGEHANLEEALVEESAHRLAVERLGEQGQSDVLAWRREHPNALSVRGVYLRERGGLADVLDRAGITDPTDRSAVIEALKFQVKPSERFMALGQLIHKAHPDVSARDAEQEARAALKFGGEPRPAVMQTPGIPKKFEKWVKEHQKRLFDEPLVAKKPPAVVLGGDVPEPDEQGPIPSFAHIPLTLEKGSPWGFGHGAKKAKHGGDSFVVQEHGGDRNHVASELLANALYRALGIKVPVAGQIATPGGPDFASVPDSLTDEPPLPEKAGRISTGVIIREKNGSITVIEPRNHYGGYQHTFPKGGLEPGLTAQQNALKELWEETGLHARITDVVGDFKGDTGMTRYYLGVRTGGEPTPSDETEAIKTVKVKQAAEMLNKQRDRDVLAAVMKMKVPKGEFPDDFPPVTPGVGLAYPVPAGKKLTLKMVNEGLGRGYMMDALLGNWDFVGPYGDNLRWLGENDPVRLNHGSAFEYRPGGGSKPYGDVPEEVWSMLHRGQGSGTVDLTEDQMRRQAAEVAQTLTPERVNTLVDAAPFTDEKMRDRVRASLLGRLDWMSKFGAGELDLPQPASGNEARALHADDQKKFTLYPEESQALDWYFGDDGRELDKTLRAGDDLSPEQSKHVKRLDGLLKDKKASADTRGFLAFDGDVGKVLGQTVKQKSFTQLSTHPPADAKTLVRVLLPGGGHVFHQEDAPPGSPDLVIPRGARLKFTGQSTDENGQNVVDAMMLPYDPPPTLFKPWKGSKSYKPPPPPKGQPKSKFKRDDPVVLNGMPGKVVAISADASNVWVKMETGKEYQVPASSVKPAGMSSPGTTAVRVAPNEVQEDGHRWVIERRALVPGHPELEGMTDGTAIAHYRPGETRTNDFRYVTDLARARRVLDEWKHAGMKSPGAQIAEAALQEADSNPDGVMVALYPHPATAKKFAVAGGEDPDALHVTLAYLGNQDDLADPDALRQHVADWAARTPPLEGEVSGHGVFTAGEKPVTYLSPDLAGLPAARQDLVDTLDAGGNTVAKEHGYTPHITLAYADKAKRLPDYGGHKLKFSRAALVVGANKETFKLGGKLQETAMVPGAEPPSQDEREAFYAVHGRESGVSLKKDKDGFFVHTHRARSRSYPKPGGIPKSAVEFIGSTG